MRASQQHRVLAKNPSHLAPSFSSALPTEEESAKRQIVSPVVKKTTKTPYNRTKKSRKRGEQERVGGGAEYEVFRRRELKHRVIQCKGSLTFTVHGKSLHK